MPLTADGTYCSGCGYDLRGLSSERCPECGLTIASMLAGIIPWERRKGIGYFRAFFRTSMIATFKPTQLARATSGPIDVRSARLFRWIVRILAIVPLVTLFVFATVLNGGITAVAIVSGPIQGAGPPFEPFFLWGAGATFWPTLPIGVAITIILMTGISHWFFMRRLEPVRRNRAMAFSFYLPSAIGWLSIPCIAIAASVLLSDSNMVGSSHFIDNMNLVCALLAGCGMLILLLAMLNSLRAIHTATQCGTLGSLSIGIGIIAQAVASTAIGLFLFPSMIGLLRLMIGSLLR